jgi:hypothetical protein
MIIIDYPLLDIDVCGMASPPALITSTSSRLRRDGPGPGG